jgi:hypothetical protein
VEFLRARVCGRMWGVLLLQKIMLQVEFMVAVVVLMVMMILMMMMVMMMIMHIAGMSAVDAFLWDDDDVDDLVEEGKLKR